MVDIHTDAFRGQGKDERRHSGAALPTLSCGVGRRGIRQLHASMSA
jgi:hypothetical protein